MRVDVFVPFCLVPHPDMASVYLFFSTMIRGITQTIGELTRPYLHVHNVYHYFLDVIIIRLPIYRSREGVDNLICGSRNFPQSKRTIMVKFFAEQHNS